MTDSKKKIDSSLVMDIIDATETLSDDGFVEGSFNVSKKGRLWDIDNADDKDIVEIMRNEETESFYDFDNPDELLDSKEDVIIYLLKKKGYDIDITR